MCTMTSESAQFPNTLFKREDNTAKDPKWSLNHANIFVGKTKTKILIKPYQFQDWIIKSYNFESEIFEKDILLVTFKMNDI